MTCYNLLTDNKSRNMEGALGTSKDSVLSNKVKYFLGFFIASLVMNAIVIPILLTKLTKNKIETTIAVSLAIFFVFILIGVGIGYVKDNKHKLSSDDENNPPNDIVVNEAVENDDKIHAPDLNTHLAHERIDSAKDGESMQSQSIIIEQEPQCLTDYIEKISEKISKDHRSILEKEKISLEDSQTLHKDIYTAIRQQPQSL